MKQYCTVHVERADVQEYVIHWGNQWGKYEWHEMAESTEAALAKFRADYPHTEIKQFFKVYKVRLPIPGKDNDE